MQQTLAEDIALWKDLGIDNVGLISPKLEAAGWETSRHAVLDAGIVVSSMSCYRDGIPSSLEFTVAVGAGVLYVPSGRAGAIPWEDAAAAYCEDMAPLVARAKTLGVKLATEPTNPLRTDVSFVHSVRDAIDLARMADVSIVVDFYSAWY
jgi:sugar phosphate isomerase/epimerase